MYRNFGLGAAKLDEPPRHVLAFAEKEIGFPEEAAAVPPPPPQDVFRYMYADMTPPLIEQEASLLASLQREG